MNGIMMGSTSIYGSNGTNPEPLCQPEHLETATKMANEITTLDPFKQNEMLSLIMQIITSRRESDLKEQEERFAYLKESYSQMPSVK